MKKPLVLPKFKNEDEEREFWYNIDLTDYFEPGDFVRASFPNLKPTPPEKLKGYFVKMSRVRKVNK